MKVERIDYVAIFVKDLDKAIEFFSELFETEFCEPFASEIADVTDAMAPLGIDLCTPLTPDGPASRLIARRGEGLSMISFKVSNLEEAVAEMKSRGIRLVYREKRGKAEYATFHPKDTFGAWIELVEYKDERKHPMVSALGF